MKYCILIILIPFLTSCSRLDSQNMMTKEPQGVRDTKSQSDVDTFSGSLTREQKETLEKNEVTASASLNKEKGETNSRMMSAESNEGSRYQPYSATFVDMALKSGKKVALFFSASWCPTCKALNANIESNLSAIPADSLIVKVDYDDSDELKRKYGVVSQHTTVILDASGNLVSKKLGARSIEEVFN